MIHVKELVHSRPATAGDEHRPSLVPSACWRNEQMSELRKWILHCFLLPQEDDAVLKWFQIKSQVLGRKQALAFLYR